MSIGIQRIGGNFEKQMRDYAQMYNIRLRTLIERIGDHTERSIVDGSRITGAPGQPVRSGTLYLSWKRLQHATGFKVFTNLRYAKYIEDNLQGMQLRSKVGGFHSVKLTRHGFKNIVKYELGLLRAMSGGITLDTQGKWRDAKGRFASGPRS